MGMDLRYAAGPPTPLHAALLSHFPVSLFSLCGSMFAARLEAETAGCVVFRRLPQTHPQFLRCRRAALENVKKGFFVPGGRFSGTNPSRRRLPPPPIPSALSLSLSHTRVVGTLDDGPGLTVMDVFKIENKIMLRRFQKASANLDQGRVKGLFCSLPAASLERVVAHGLGAHKISAAERAATFRATWLAAVADLDKLAGRLPNSKHIDWRQPHAAQQRVEGAEAVAVSVSYLLRAHMHSTPTDCKPVPPRLCTDAAHFLALLHLV